jgi:uncharacterized protein YndB with AHSA1/START domain
MRTFRFHTTWELPAAREAVWEVLTNARSWPTWWPAIAAVNVLEDGDELGVGQRVRVTVRSGVGYRLTFTLLITEVVHLSSVLARSVGHLDGHGHWTLTDDAEGWTAVDIAWEVALRHAWLSPMVPLAAPFFAARHDAVMRDGERGLVQLLGPAEADHR